MLTEQAAFIAMVHQRQVLILVLMEYALRVKAILVLVICSPVLILVLMEYALREHVEQRNAVYFNSLNPCFNGICSQSGMLKEEGEVFVVLILVLMEYALRVSDIPRYMKASLVLILVLMEYALRENELCRLKYLTISLNPCFNGICSQRAKDIKPQE